MNGGREYNHLLRILDRPVAFHRVFVTLTNGVLSALMLSQAIYWHPRSSLEDGWFYKTQADWEEETGLSRWEQESARKKLLQVRAPNGKPIWEEKKSGLPAKLYYKINVEALFDCLFSPSNQPASKDVEIPHPRMLDSHIQECGFTADKNVVLPQTSVMDSHIQSIYTESTTETTTESRSAADAAPAATPDPYPDTEPVTEAKAEKQKPSDHPAVQAYRALYERFPTKAQMKIIAQKNPPLDNWIRAITKWAERAYDPSKIDGMLEWAFDPTLMERRPPRAAKGNGIYADASEVVPQDAVAQAEMDAWARQAYPERFRDIIPEEKE